MCFTYIHMYIFLFIYLFICNYGGFLNWGVPPIIHVIRPFWYWNPWWLWDPPFTGPVLGWWATSARMVSQSCSLYVPCGLPRLPTSLRAKHDDDDDGDGDGVDEARCTAHLFIAISSVLFDVHWNSFFHFKLTWRPCQNPGSEGSFPRKNYDVQGRTVNLPEGNSQNPIKIIKISLNHNNKTPNIPMNPMI